MSNTISSFQSQELNPGFLTHIWGLILLHHALISYKSLLTHGKETTGQMHTSSTC